jgi:molybdate transport system ATP-binding protein
LAGDDALRVEVSVAAEARGLPPRLEARFEVPPGITVLFGPSGAGKSTCLAAVAGLLRPHRGRITLGQAVLTDTAAGVHVPPHRRKVALVFQSLALFPHLTVARNVAYAVPPGPARQRQAEAERWLERMRVGALSARRPATLSGGEAQRVALARALASRPRVLLLDEPFSALDFALRRELGAELAGLVRELSLPTLLVTHDRADALLLGARMVALAGGRMTAQGSPAEVLG